jgi:hypothetical protein
VPRIPSLSQQIVEKFTVEAFDLSLKNLAKGNTPSPDKIRNEIFKTLPNKLHNPLFHFLEFLQIQKIKKSLSQILDP